MVLVLTKAVLVKLLLFERCGNPVAYSKLLSEVNENREGKPLFLKEWASQYCKREGTKLEG